MPKNLEVKARIKDPRVCEGIIKSIGSSFVGILNQTDTYFHTRRGRLKLREITDAAAELIYYEREEETVHRLSQFDIVRCDNPSALKAILEESVGIRGVVKKKRKLFMYNVTRVHLDEVENLGHFLELETPVTLSVEESETINEYITDRLQLSRDDFITGSYIDLLLSSR